jgi:hypothetical protein
VTDTRPVRCPGQRAADPKNWCDLAAGLTGTVQLVVDVTGYFE